MSALIWPFLGALLLTVLVGGPGIGLLKRLRVRQIISTDAPERHQQKAGTPSMGGAIFLPAGFIVGLLLGPWTPGLLAVTLATAAFAGIGFLDDILIVLRGKNLGLKARQKLALQFFVGLLFVLWFHGSARDLPGAAGLGTLGGQRVDPTGAAVTGAVLTWGVLHLLLLVGMSNAVNLTDGLDGLAAGLAVPVWLLLGMMAYLAPQLPGERLGWDHGVATFCMAMAGACLGFLWFNSHPAAVIMGDTGSLALGGGMAAAAILLGAEIPLLIAGVVYLAEAASVTLQVISYKTTRRRIFRMSPLHHHFELVGWAETQIVARFRLLGVAGAALALLWLMRS
jgi:phospho-N-acetylmuramoyl-pentapeptide-transferase